MVGDSGGSLLNCLACGAAEVRKIETWGDYRVFQCARCRLEFSDPMRSMSAQEYEQSADYRRFRELSEADPAAVLWWGHRQFLREVQVPASRAPGPKLLDVGCGPGMFVRAALAKRFDAYGADFDRVSVEFARKSPELRDRVRQTDLTEQIDQTDRHSYDFVTLFEVLEHVEDPAKLLLAVAGFLKPQGKVVILVPQADRHSLKHQAREPRDCPPHHLTRWTAAALKVLMERCGYRTVRQLESPVSFGLLGRLRPAGQPGPQTSNRWRERAFRLKQTLAGPVLSACGFRGDRILLIAEPVA